MIHNRSVAFPVLGIRSVRSSPNPQPFDPSMASLEEMYEMDADAMADRDKITGLLYTINQIIAPDQFVRSQELKKFATDALERQYNARYGRPLGLLVTEDAPFNIREEIGKLFSFNDPSGFEHCFGMDDRQLDCTKILFLESILSACMANPLAMFVLLKKDLDEAREELAMTRNSKDALQAEIMEEQEKTAELQKRMRDLERDVVHKRVCTA